VTGTGDGLDGTVEWRRPALDRGSRLLVGIGGLVVCFVLGATWFLVLMAKDVIEDPGVPLAMVGFGAWVLAISLGVLGAVVVQRSWVLWTGWVVGAAIVSWVVSAVLGLV
jgi:hypothetical protein